MLNLKLLTNLQGDTTANLILKPSKPGMLQFFVISSSVTCSIVVSGECEGEIPAGTPYSFDIALSTLAPLLDKNYKFRLMYSKGCLKFVESEGKFTLEPLYVEHISDTALATAKKYMECAEALSAHDDEEEEDIDDGIIKSVSFSDMRKIANIAAKANTTIAMCDDYAVVNLGTAFVIQKVKCGVRSIQGKLLQRLLMDPAGRFYEYRDELLFTSSSGKGDERSTTFVFISPYLPDTTINPTLLTRGAVKEKYSINLKGILKILPTVLNKFDFMSFDMGTSCSILSNDRGENITYKFDIDDAKTIELNKIMRGEASSGVVMSTIEIPRVIQGILSYMKESFTIYVKERKIILQSESLYVVFSR